MDTEQSKAFKTRLGSKAMVIPLTRPITQDWKYWDTPEEAAKWLTEVVGEYRPDINNKHRQLSVGGEKKGKDDGDLGGSIAFLSLIGKDTAIQEFRARWSLPITQGGLTDFQVETPDSTVRLNLGSPESLEFLSGRLPTYIFGSLIQVFVYKQLVQKPDFANRKAVQLFRKEDDNNPSDKLWALIKNLSPLPLLDQWRDVILNLFREKHWLQELPGMGDVSAHVVSIPEDELAELLKANIQNGILLAEINMET